MRILQAGLVVILALALGFAAFLYSGTYAIGADVPHSKLTYLLLETLRENSIERASRELMVPSLADSELMMSGGPDYHEMCVSCHLSPGMGESEISRGLYPRPPDLSQSSVPYTIDDNGDTTGSLARRQFWVIKHGIKGSGMPAWGVTHDDQRIWAMVAFIQKLPQLTASQYEALVTRTDDSHGHQHEHH
jgi:mono/diheme cytochrome c family protein